jgi:hypothetical protein
VSLGVTWGDRILGIVLGVLLGAGTVVVFVFVFSEQTVDAPSISDEDGTGRAGGRAAKGGQGGGAGRPPPPPVETVRIVGGVPPAAGPAQLDYRQGERVRLRIVSDQTVRLQALGLGIDRTARPGRPTAWRFKASKAGDFALVVLPSRIDVARISVGAPAR